MIHDSFQTLAKTAHLLNDLFPQNPRKKISLKLPKDYVVLCHGHVSPEQDLISAPLYWAEGTHLPTLVRSYGRPAQTRVKVLAHCYQQARDLVGMKVRGVEKKGIPLPTTIGTIGISWCETVKFWANIMSALSCGGRTLEKIVIVSRLGKCLVRLCTLSWIIVV